MTDVRSNLWIGAAMASCGWGIIVLPMGAWNAVFAAIGLDPESLAAFLIRAPAGVAGIILVVVGARRLYQAIKKT